MELQTDVTEKVKEFIGDIVVKAGFYSLVNSDISKEELDSNNKKIKYFQRETAIDFDSYNVLQIEFVNGKTIRLFTSEWGWMENITNKEKEK